MHFLYFFFPFTISFGPWALDTELRSDDWVPAPLMCLSFLIYKTEWKPDDLQVFYRLDFEMPVKWAIPEVKGFQEGCLFLRVLLFAKTKIILVDINEYSFGWKKMHDLWWRVFFFSEIRIYFNSVRPSSLFTDLFVNFSLPYSPTAVSTSILKLFSF